MYSNKYSKNDSEILYFPSLDFVNGNWNTIVQFLEYEGSPKWGCGGNINLEGRTDITSLHNLVYVDGYLDLSGCVNLKSLGELEYVDGWLSLEDTKVESIGNLKYVGSFIFLSNSKVLEIYGKKRIEDLLSTKVSAT